MKFNQIVLIFLIITFGMMINLAYAQSLPVDCNDIIFTNESLIKKSLKKLDSKKIFIDISKDLNSQKFNQLILKDYDLFINSITNMVELSSSIMLTIENTDNIELKKELKSSFKEIKEFLDESNEILMKFRGSNERIVLQRILNNRIPKPGCLKI